MSALGFVFTLVNAILLMILPRRWASLPLLMGAAYMTLGQQIELGPLHFPVIRILIAVGFARVFTNRECIAGGLTRLDWTIFAWACWVIISAFFHSADSVVLRLGIV